MNFNQGDHVIHQSFGVGTVVSIEGMNFAGGEPQLFYRVDFIKTTVWVPVGNQPKGGLRTITPRGHLAQYRALLESSPVTLDRDFRKRQIELEKRINRGTFQGLCEVVRDLNALDAEKPLNYYEKKLYKRTREALAVEWSATSGLSYVESLSEIDGCLHEGSRSLENV